MNETVVWLNRARNIQKSLDSLMLSRERAYEQATSITSQLNGDTVSGSKEPHKLDKLLDLDLQIQKCENKLLQTKLEIVTAISYMHTYRYRDILLKRFVDSLYWETIEEELNYSHTQVMRDYKSAIKEISPIIRRTKDAN